MTAPLSKSSSSGSDASNKFQSGTEGASSERDTKQNIVPDLRYDNPNPDGKSIVKLDGMANEKTDDGKVELIDRKTNVADYHPKMEQKTIDGLSRQTEALRQNPEFTIVHEYPNQQAGDKAQQRYEKWGYGDSIQVRVKKQD